MTPAGGAGGANVVVDLVDREMVELREHPGEVVAVAVHVAPPRGPLDARRGEHLGHAVGA